MKKSSVDQLEQFLVPERRERLHRVASARTRQLTIVLDGVLNAHNISAVLRSAEAFGIQDVHLISSGTDLSSGISLGSERWLNIHRYDHSDAALAALRSGAFRLVSLEAPPLDEQGDSSRRAIPVYSLPFHEHLALVFGNEHSGISPAILSACELSAFIPMLGFVESFNISVAAAIAMFCSLLGSVEGRRSVEPLSQAERDALYALWVEQSLRDGAAIRREIERRESAADTDPNVP